MPKRDDPAKLAAIERLIEIAGSKREAHRLIEGANLRGRSGRPAEYSATDAQVLFEVERLEDEYGHGVGKLVSAKVPKRRRLIKEIVSRELANKKQVGKSIDAATQRIGLNTSLIELLIKSIRKNRPELAAHLPPDAEKRIRKSDPNGVSFATILELLSIYVAFEQKSPGIVARAQKKALQKK